MTNNIRFAHRSIVSVGACPLTPLLSRLFLYRGHRVCPVEVGKLDSVVSDTRNIFLDAQS